MNIALASSLDSDTSLDSGFSHNDDLKLSSCDTNSTLDSSFDSDDGGDPWELEGNPGPLLELYFVMDGTRYHVDHPMTRKS